MYSFSYSFALWFVTECWIYFPVLYSRALLFVKESESRSVMSGSLWPHGLLLYRPWNSPGQNNGVGSLSLLQGIFLAQVSNPGLWHCRQILYQLSHKGSSGILEWVAYSPGQNTGVGSLSLLQWIFLTQESNRVFLRCRRILYQLSSQGNPLFIHPICKNLHLLIPNSHYVASSKWPEVGKGPKITRGMGTGSGWRWRQKE